MKSILLIIALFAMAHQREKASTKVFQLDGRSLVKELAEGRIRAEDLMVATLDRIEAINPKVNAIVALRDRDDLIREARQCDQNREKQQGKLLGIPFAIKDLSNVAGVPTTMGGSPLFRFHVPSVSDPFARRIVEEGAIIIGKTNTPELGVGSHTFNQRWGTTRNPYDLSKSSGGSSGGAAVAVATRMLCLADGSDMMGSLRNPAGWDNIYSHRPTAGIIDNEAESLPDAINPLPYPISTCGPMARNPLDLAYLLEVMAGKDVFDVVSKLDENPQVKGMKIAWLGNWGGAIPVEDGILPLCQEALEKFEAMGVTVDELTEAVFDFGELWSSWTTIRSRIIASNFPIPALLKHAILWMLPIREELRWEIRRGLSISDEQCAHAATTAMRWSQRLEELFSEYDAIALPTAQTWAFPAQWRWPRAIQGKEMTTYHKWMEIVMPGSLAGVPCTTVPAGFGERGLSMGIYLMGKRGDDAKLLKLAQAYHTQVDWPQLKPPVL